ncbi:MAG: chemotaxis protein CheW [Syntrophaceticus sp.]|nr:chemotaxis protein CheW [Syntrophaceticus sp.]HBG22007.1 chemotaxis protein CheW [Peptococcaceae bacterium]
MSENDVLDSDLLDDEEEDDEEGEDTQQDKFLTFSINEEEYGIEIRCVTEIIRMQKITQVPDVSDFIKGVINLRGKVISVMDVRLRFGLEERPHNNRTCIIVINVEGQVVGLIVDQVSEVLDIPASEIEPPPRMYRGVKGRFLLGLGKVEGGVKILLNAEKLLFDEEGEVNG